MVADTIWRTQKHGKFAQSDFVKLPRFSKAKECFETQTDFSLVGETFKKPRYADYPEDLSRWLEKRIFALLQIQRTRICFFG